jgi:signal peptidase I
MSGSGARDGFGSPPWDPADPVPHPDLDDTQALPGLGSIPGPNGSGPEPGGPGGDSLFGGNPMFDGAAPFGGAGTRSVRADETRVDLQAAPDRTDMADRPAGADGGRRAGRDGGNGGDGGKGGKDAKGGKQFKRRRSFLRELPVLIVVALVLALLIKSFVIQAFYIPSASMQNTLEIGDRVLISKIVYHTRPIHRGDIVVFDGTGSWDVPSASSSANIVGKAVSELEGIVGISHDSNIYIKRVIGVPGDHVACCNAKRQVTVNGVALSESSYLYPGNQPSAQSFSITVPAGRLWVMGDHRAVSYDSRGHMGDPGGGTIPVSGVLGRAFVIIWPPSRWGFLNIPATFEQPQLNASNAAAGGSTAALVSAMDNGTPIQAAGSALPLGLGFVGAVPLTLLQRTTRRRLKSRRSRRKA